MKKNKSTFNSHQFGQKHTANSKKGYIGPYMNEFGENIYDEMGQENLEFATKHKKVEIKNKSTEAPKSQGMPKNI